MSTEYNFFIGKQDRAGIIYPLGPCDIDGEICPALWISGSFTDGIAYDFMMIHDDKKSSMLENKLDSYGTLYYLPVDNLPDTNFVKFGYYLIEDIKEYMRDKSTDGIFYEYMSSDEYSIRMQNELVWGTQDTDNDEQEHSCRDYAYFSYPDYISKEYYSFLLRNASSMFEDCRALDDCRLVIIMTEG